jgi:hypothetical protein
MDKQEYFCIHKAVVFRGSLACEFLQYVYLWGAAEGGVDA